MTTLSDVFYDQNKQSFVLEKNLTVPLNVENLETPTFLLFFYVANLKQCFF